MIFPQIQGFTLFLLFKIYLLILLYIDLLAVILMIIHHIALYRDTIFQFDHLIVISIYLFFILVIDFQIQNQYPCIIDLLLLWMTFCVVFIVIKFLILISNLKIYLLLLFLICF